MAGGSELYGAFDSTRKARNAIRRIAAAERLCHSLLGLGESRGDGCSGCAPSGSARACERGPGRLAHLTRAYSALRALRVPAWPYPGPIAIRERRDVHIFDQWQYLGTAQTSPDIDGVLETRAAEFDVNVYRLLVKTLPRLPASRVVPLPPRHDAAEAKRAARREFDQRDEAVLAPLERERIAAMSSRSVLANWPAESSIGS
jgi:DNA polymerase-3 subunit epsilon